ncbi:Ribonuclease H-like domain [Phytophthora cactorum]|nr:Ribonuclease H-like domain [Phytophthora cactorum]
MVRVTRPPNPGYTNAQVAGFYFRPCRDQDDEVILEYFRCRCGTLRKQTNRNGYSNLMQHVLREHPDYEVVMLEATAAQTGSILNFIRHSSRTYSAGWSGLFSATSHFRFARAATQDVSPTLNHLRGEITSWHGRVVMAVERSIASELPASFGIMLDGWTHASEHYVAVFACYEVNGSLKTPLLSMALLLNEANNDLYAESHLDFLVTILPRDFGVHLVQCRFIVGDNGSVNRRLATLMEVSLVGCASHRLNLAVQDDLAVHEDDLAAVQVLFRYLNVIQAVHMRLSAIGYHKDLQNVRLGGMEPQDVFHYSIEVDALGLRIHRLTSHDLQLFIEFFHCVLGLGVACQMEIPRKGVPNPAADQFSAAKHIGNCIKSAAEVVEEVATEVEEPVAAVVVEEADRDDKAVAPAEIVEEKAIEEPVAAKDSVSAEEPAAADEEPYMYCPQLKREIPVFA